MRHIFLLWCCLLLVGCGSRFSSPVDVVRYDLGMADGSGPDIPLALARIEFDAPVWLTTPALHYRLSYADAQRRDAYASSRWVAPPADLLERLLQRRFQVGTVPGCHLLLRLDELEQRFVSPQSSEVILEVSASLRPASAAGAVLAQRQFHLVAPAPTPDAPGGVRATRRAADALARQLAGWLGELVRRQPQFINRCKEGS